MNQGFDEMYQEMIRDHFKNPNYRAILNPDAPLFENPSCGDQVRLQLSVEKGVVKQCNFDGAGCSISMSSTDMMCDVLEGKTLNEAQNLVARFLEIMKGKGSISDLETMGDLAALSGVVQLPVRVKCATLAWNAAAKMLEEKI